MIRTQKEAIKAIKALPLGLRKVYRAADKCVKHLIVKGQTPKEAEGAVEEILKEHTDYLQKGMYSQCIASLEMIFLDKKVEEFELKDLI